MSTLSTKTFEIPREALADYTALRSAGMRMIETLSSDHWTDYNVHDPGVTMLEHLCYAMTDLDYRTEHEMVHLLAGRERNAASPHPVDYTARRILGNAPLMPDDYRRLLIDIPGVRNAWALPVQLESPPLYINRKTRKLSLQSGPDRELMPLRGFWEFYYEPADRDLGVDAQKVIEDRLNTVVHRNRGLCEDILAVRKIKSEEILVCAEFVIDSEVEIDELEARVIHAIDQFISPPVPFYSLEEMRERGTPVEEIFHGPVLNHGFVLDEDLERTRLRSDIHISDLLQVLHDLDGIQAISSLMMTGMRDGQTVNPGKTWVLPLDLKRAPRFVREHSRFTYVRNRIPLRARRDQVDRHLETLRGKSRNPRLVPVDYDLAGPEGNPVSIGRYRSVQNEFPLNYGIGREGLADSASDLRKAQAKQLKAYLLMAEQVLANHAAQLEQLPDLFSLKSPEELGRTLFVRLVEGIEGVSDILLQDKEAYVAALEGIVENRDEFYRRRSRMLDHLLARYGERYAPFNPITESTVPPDRFALRLLRDKIHFLAHLPSRVTESGEYLHGLHEARGLARAYRHGPSERINASGLERRLRVLLDVRDDADSDPSARELFHYVDVSANQDGSKFRIDLISDGKVQLQSAARLKKTDTQEAFEALVDFVSLSRTRDCYAITENPKSWTVALLDEDGEVFARPRRSFSDEVSAIEWVEDTVKLVDRDHAPEERVYVLEHLLLRPRETDENPVLLPVPDDSVQDAEGEGQDPYSFRITVVLPYWPRRFRNMRLRRHFELIIREHTPAHIYTRICWVDPEDMEKFEQALAAWRQALAEQSDELQIRQDALIEVWCKLKSIYPKSTLSGCTIEDESETALLDNLRLGTFKEEKNENP